MTDTFASSARPPYAVTMWADDRSIYAELPVVDGPPYIMRFDKTEGGLSKALHILMVAHRDNRPTGGSYKLPEQSIIKRKPEVYTPAQRAAAKALLKRMKIT